MWMYTHKIKLGEKFQNLFSVCSSDLDTNGNKVAK